MTKRSSSPLAVKPLIAMWILLLGGPRASADSAVTPGASMAKFEQGKQAFKDGRFLEALAAFEASMQLEPSPNTRFQMARCYIALGKTASAYSNFKRAAQEAEDRVSATHDKRYAATRDAALAEVRALDGKVPRADLRVAADAPSGFAVELDGKSVPTAAWNTTMEIDAGTHELVTSGPRLKRNMLTFEIKALEHKVIDAPVVHLPTATVRIELPSRPAGLAISLDEQPLPPEQFDKTQSLDVGTHKLTARAAGYADFAWTSFLRDGETVAIPVVFRSVASGPPRWLTPVLGGATLAALCVAIGFGVRAQSAADEQQMLVPLLRDPAAQDSIRTDAILANAFYGVTGLLAINTAIIAATTKWRGRAPSSEAKPVKQSALLPQLVPSAGPGRAQLSLIGRF